MSYRVNTYDFLEMVNYSMWDTDQKRSNRGGEVHHFTKDRISIKKEVIKENLSIVKTNYYTQKDLILDCSGTDSFLELHFNLSKSGIYYKNSFVLSEEVSPMTGNMIYVAPNDDKSELSFHKGMEYVTFDIHFSLNMLSEYAGENKLLDFFLAQASQQKSVGLTDNAIKVDSRILSNIQDIENCCYEGLTRKIYLEAKVYEIFAYCFEESPQNCVIKLSKRDIDCINYAAQFIKDHINNPITIRELAKEIGMNETKLKKGFKSIFGITIFGYLQNLRMSRARRLLFDSDLSIAEISHKCGYINVSNFSNAFKNYFGTSPSFFKSNVGVGCGSSRIKL